MLRKGAEMSVKLEGHRMYAAWKSRAMSQVETYVDSIITGRLEEAKADAISTLKENNNVVTNELAREESFEIVKEKGGGMNSAWSMHNVMPYAKYVERGTMPHFPPLRAMIEFVVIKHGLSEKDAYPLAKAIQATIGRRGTQPYPFMRPAFERMREKLRKDLKRFSMESGIGGRAFTRYYGE